MERKKRKGWEREGKGRGGERKRKRGKVLIFRVGKIGNVILNFQVRLLRSAKGVTVYSEGKKGEKKREERGTQVIYVF